MRNVSICFYVSQQHVECFQIADKRCKIKQQLCSRGSHSASPASQPASQSQLLQAPATATNNTKRQTKPTNDDEFRCLWTAPRPWSHGNQLFTFRACFCFAVFALTWYSVRFCCLLSLSTSSPPTRSAWLGARSLTGPNGFGCCCCCCCCSYSCPATICSLGGNNGKDKAQAPLQLQLQLDSSTRRWAIAAIRNSKRSFRYRTRSLLFQLEL